MIKSSAIALSVGAITAAAVGAEVYKLSHSLCSLHRVDEQGTLYYAEYRGCYYDPIVRLPMKLVRSGGCSAFVCRSSEGELLSCRNYDMPHRNRQGEVTGLNVVLRCAPKDKYRSLGVADGAWLSVLKLPYEAGALDGKAPKLPLALLPWLTMDGINEKGLCLSIHALDVKKGETAVNQTEKGKATVTVNELLRRGLDDCADVVEFIALAESVNMRSLFHADFHLFAADAQGRSAVLEWRHNTLRITAQDAVTNFLVSDDDAEDVYWKGQFKESFTEPPMANRPYRYGYGHGYHRFFTLAEALRDHGSDVDSLAVMRERECAGLLAAVSQEFDGSDTTSCTQYSAIYHHDALSLDVFAMRDYEKMYSFTL